MGGFKMHHLPRVQRQAISWLWPGHIPRRKFTLLSGNPGLGKSWVAWDLAARLTARKPWPDGAPPAPPGNVIILSAEDDADDTIAPRLDALGAVQERVWIAEPTGGFNLQDDLEVLRAEIVQRQAVFVVIDPLTAFLGKVDSFKDAEVRALTGRFKSMIEETDVAILGIMHHNKDERRRAAYRVLGSIAFTAAPRSHYMIETDPNDEERRFFMCQKLSVGQTPATLAFRLTARGPVWEPLPVLHATPDTILASAVAGEERTSRDSAVEFLQQILSAGEIATKDVNRIGKSQGFSERTLERARRHLGIVPRHDGGLGVGGHWYISLPPSPPLQSLAAFGGVGGNGGGIKGVGGLDGRAGATKAAKAAKAAGAGEERAARHAVNWDAINEED